MKTEKAVSSADSPGVREQLLQNNPFSSGSAPGPWGNEEPDVSSLNHRAYENICALIHRKNREPDSCLGGLVLGEAGMGKTHFQKRLLDFTRQNDIPAVFASVIPLLNPKKPLRHVLREIVVNLKRVQTSGKIKSDSQSQFESMRSRIMQRYSNESGKSPVFSNFRSYFDRLCPAIDSHVLKAILDYSEPDRQSLILDWLEGSVNEEHVTVLGLPERENMDGFDLEEEARRILLSLGFLLKYCGMSMILCFDQLDSMGEDELIQAFGKIVFVLVNDVPGMLPLAFIRDMAWSERFVPRIDPAVAERLLNNKEILESCSLAQAEELIKLRVKSRFKEDFDEKYQWLTEKLRGKLKEGAMPRHVIGLANEVILHPDHPPMPGPRPEPESSDIAAVLAGEYRRAREKVVADFDLWPPDAERLQKALKSYLETRPEYEALQPGDNKYIAFTGKYRKPDGSRIDCAFILNTASHYKTVQAAFTRGVDFLKHRPGSRCYYIGDGRSPFRDTWKTARKVRDDFEAFHGTTLFLEDTQLFDWYGLTALMFKLESKDIAFPASMGFRTATAEDFTLYMREGFTKNLLEPLTPPLSVKDAGATPPCPPPPAPPAADAKALVDKSAAILKNSPMRFMALALLCGKLGQAGENVTHDALLFCLSKHNDIFELFDSTNDKLVMLKS